MIRKPEGVSPLGNKGDRATLIGPWTSSLGNRQSVAGSSTASHLPSLWATLNQSSNSARQLKLHLSLASSETHDLREGFSLRL